MINFFRKSFDIFIKNNLKRIVLSCGTNYIGQSHALNGCLNDMIDIKSEIPKIIDVDNVIELLGSDMTTNNWLELLERELSNAKERTILLHAHSHHGAQIQDKTEKDGLSEVWCPDDFSWNPNKMITDKQMNKLLAKLNPGAVFIDWADCCHASDSLRVLFFKNEQAKFIKNPKDKLIQNINRVISTPIDTGYPNVIQLAACRSNQTSADAYIDGRFCGAFTHYMLEAWKSLNNKATYGATIDAANNLLSRNGYSQNPEFCGSNINANKLLFNI